MIIDLVDSPPHEDVIGSPNLALKPDSQPVEELINYFFHFVGDDSDSLPNYPGDHFDFSCFFFERG